MQTYPWRFELNFLENQQKIKLGERKDHLHTGYPTYQTLKVNIQHFLATKII